MKKAAEKKSKDKKNAKKETVKAKKTESKTKKVEKKSTKEEIIKGVSEYRKIKGKNSTALLGMMWFFDEHDDVLMELDEEYREVYPPVVVKKQIVKKKVKKEKQKEETKTI